MNLYIAENAIDFGIYCNFFGPDCLYIYNLQDVDTSSIKQMTLNRCTMSNRGFTNKKIIELPTSSAQKYKRVEGK